MNKNLLALKKKAASDNIYRLCVKIISWKMAGKLSKLLQRMD